MRQNYPLDLKVEMAKRRIASFVDYYGEEGVYVGFSGGKDSLVVLNIARKMYPNLKAVYNDTWLEYPQIRQFVHSFKNVDFIKSLHPHTYRLKVHDNAPCSFFPFPVSMHKQPHLNK